MEGLHDWLALAAIYASRLERLFALPLDEAGRPSLFLVPYVRQRLAEAMRQAADYCEVIGAEQNDTRWCGPVALIHHASGQVWTVQDAATCKQIAALMVHMRTLVTLLKDRALGREVAVRLN
jgi:hypothetical protein